MPPNTEDYSARIEGGLNKASGGDQGHSVRGAVNLPIIRDKVALRGSGFTRHDPGYLDNINATAAGEDINKTSVKGGRAALLIKPTDAFTIDLSAMRQRAHFFGTPRIRVCPSCGTGPFTGTPDFTPYYGDMTLNVAPTKRDVSFTLYQGRANLDLGFADLTSITAWDRVKSASDLDQTNTFRFLLPAFSAPAGSSVSLINADQTEKFSQEIRLASKSDGPLEWLVGGFYTHEKIVVDQVLVVHAAGGADTTAYTSAAPAKFEEKAAFADVTYHFTSKFDVQVGGVIRPMNRTAARRRRSPRRPSASSAPAPQSRPPSRRTTPSPGCSPPATRSRRTPWPICGSPPATVPAVRTPRAWRASRCRSSPTAWSATRRA